MVAGRTGGSDAAAPAVPTPSAPPVERVRGKDRPTIVGLLIPYGSLTAAVTPGAITGALRDEPVLLGLAAFLVLLLVIRITLTLFENLSLTRTLERRVVDRTKDLEAALREREAHGRALIQSEERFRMLAETASDVVFRFRLLPEPAFEYLSPSVERITGYTLQELYDDPPISWFRIVEDLDNIFQQLHDSTERPVEMRWRRKDGTLIWIELRTAVILNADGEPAIFQGIARDISSRKESLAGLATHAAIVASTADAIMSIDLESRFTTWNPGATRMFGYTEDEILGKPVVWLIPSERIGEMMAARRRCLAGESVGPFTTKRMRKDGTALDVSVTLSPIIDEHGDVIGVSGIMQDVTTRMQAEERLRLSEERNRIILETANAAVIGTDQHGRIADWNRRAEAIFGWKAAEVLGRGVGFLFPEKHRTVQEETLREVLRTGRGPGVGRPVQFTAITLEGRRIRVEAHVWPVEAENRRRIFAFVIDITERSRAERALRRSEETFRRLLQAAPDAAVIVDARRRIVLVNTAAENMFGYPLERLLGEPVETLIPTGLPSGSPIAEGQGRRRDETTFPIDVRLSSVTTEDETFTTAFIRDITERKLVEEALRRSEKRFRSLLQSAPDAAVIIDAAGRIVLANDEAERLYGYDHGDLAGRDIEVLVPERFRSHHILQVATYLHDAKMRSLGHGNDLWARRKDGTEFPVEASLSSFETDDGVFLTALIRDVSERRKVESVLRRSEERFRAIFEEGPVGIVVTALDGTMVRANPAFAAMLGYTTDELTAQPLNSIAHDDDRLIGLDERQDLLAGRLASFRVQKRYCRKDGSMIWADLTWSTIREEGDAILVALVQDVTTQKRAEDALRQANEELRRANEAKSVFLARMSHELRTPLSAILISAEMLTTPAYGARTDEMLTQLGSRILQGGRHLLGLIDDLLDLTRIETGRLQISPVPLSAAGLMSELEGALGPQARRKRVRLELPEADGLTLLADPLRVRQVFLNLIGNAIKFTDTGGSIWVGTTARAGKVTISVSDTGPGIAPEDLGRIFEPFEQATRRTDGAGLGLAIAKQIVEMHGGTIEVSSEVGKGTTFLVTLASATGPAAEEPSEDDASPPAPTGRILLVEDDEDIAVLMMNVLESAGFEAERASTAPAAARAAHRMHPDLVLLDIGLGADSGLDIVEDLRSWPGGTDTKVLALSAFAMPEEIQRAKDAGCDDYLVKPISGRDIVARIGHWLSAPPRNGDGSSGNGKQKSERDATGAALGPNAAAK